MNRNAFPGHELRERREELGLTVDEVFRKIRVPSQHVRALEDADFRGLPAVSYAVGFLKTYCEFLGLDTPRYVDSLRACVRPTSTRFLGIPRKESAASAPDWFRELVAWGTICGILALCWLAYSVVFHPSSDVTEGRVHAGTVELVLPDAPATHHK